MKEETVKIEISEGVGQVSGIFIKPRSLKCWMVLSHGAGAGMDHPFMRRLAEALAVEGIATLRYNFPYMEAGRKAPGSAKVSLRAIESALQLVRKRARGKAVFLGGKSYGGRMSSHLAAQVPIPVAGLVYYGFPLHAPGKVSISRADHLNAVDLPMLFLQGTKDKLADPKSIKKVIAGLTKADLHWIEDGDHSFKVPKRAGRAYEEIITELARVTGRWCDAFL